VTAVSDAPALALAARRRTVIDAPGVYAVPEDDYHADPVPGGSLSTSWAKKLLPPSCPALFDHERRHGQPRKKVWDFGIAAHAEILGTGPELVVVEAENWRTGKAQAERDDAYAGGAIPLLPHEYAQIMAMAAALHEHPAASRLFAAGTGLPEQSLFWRDPPTGIMRRSRLDWLPVVGSRRLIVPDYKSARAVDLAALSKAMNDFGNHMQAAAYLDGVKALGIDAEPGFVNVYQAKTPPYLVRVVEVDFMALTIGRDLNRRALDIYAECTASGHWPGYPDIDLLGLPGWVEAEYLRETS
jgi:hypothetical protein